MKSLLSQRNSKGLIFSALFSLLPLLGYTENSEAIIKDIRARYNQIEGAKLRSQEIEFTSDSDPVSGTFTRYYQGDALVKIKLSYSMGDHGGSEEFFYYDQGELFFVFATDTAWGFSGETLPNGESGTVDTAIEHRVYFRQGAVVRHLSREVKSKDPTAISALLQKAPNIPGTDKERIGSLSSIGQGAYHATSGAAILKVLVP
jgi:hypothetical protein